MGASSAEIVQRREGSTRVCQGMTERRDEDRIARPRMRRRSYSDDKGVSSLTLRVLPLTLEVLRLTLRVIPLILEVRSLDAQSHSVDTRRSFA